MISVVSVVIAIGTVIGTEIEIRTGSGGGARNNKNKILRMFLSLSKI